MNSFLLSQQLSGAPLGSSDSIISTQKYLAAAGGVSSTCPASSKRTKSFSTPTLDLEAVAGISFPDVTQGATNMCSSFALANAYSLRFALQYSLTTVPRLSALYAYYFQRIQECTLTKTCACPSSGSCSPPCLDCGSYLDTALGVFKEGVCTTADWPYSNSLNSTPSDAAVSGASKYKILTTTCLNPGDVLAVKAALDNQTPVVVFLNITGTQMAWMNAQTTSVARSIDEVELPAFQKTSSTVGHVVMLCGYNDTHFIARNNFGSTWGYKGRFVILLSQYTKTQVYRSVSIDVVS